MRTRTAFAVSVLLPVVFLTAVTGRPATVAFSTAAAQGERARQLGDEGMARLMNGDLDGAIAIFHQIQAEDAASPLGYLLEANALWWKIYYTTADLIDPDVFDAVSLRQTPYDSEFQTLIQTAIHKAKSRIEQREDVARSTLYEGMAYALLGRLDGLRSKDLATARDGKKMRSLLLTAIGLDNRLTDAYTGIGLYNYFVDTLPTIVKALRFLIGLPGGNRELGIQQITLAAARGELTRAEAKFYLAKNYTRSNENQFGKALQLFEELSNQYPENPFWELMAASVDMRLGHRKQGDALYRQVLSETANSDTLVNKAVHRAVVKALQRSHQQEKFE
ncbi:MAG: tetratricopeptide repeat protein [Terriglobia bacterium]